MNLSFSIIIPIYKVESYLHECIESVINQTYKNIEIILVDDGSPDNCPQICEEYAKKDTRIKVIHKNNGGLVSARKSGASIATGDYICCVDGDDYIDKKYIEELANSSNNGKSDIICCGYIINDTISNKPGKAQLEDGIYSKEQIKKYIYPILISSINGEYLLPTVWGKAIRREIYFPAQMNVSDSISIGEDGACTIPCMLVCNELSIISKPLYYYRFNRNSMTKAKKSLDWEGQKLIASILKDATKHSDYDFADQINRRITKGFFTVAKSKFNSDRKYTDIRKDILHEIGNPVYSEAIRNCHFSKSSKLQFISFILRYRLIFLLWMTNKIV